MATAKLNQNQKRWHEYVVKNTPRWYEEARQRVADLESLSQLGPNLTIATQLAEARAHLERVEEAVESVVLATREDMHLSDATVKYIASDAQYISGGILFTAADPTYRGRPIVKWILRGDNDQ